MHNFIKRLSLLLFILSLGGCFKVNDTNSTSGNTARIKTVHGDILFSFYTKEATDISEHIKNLIDKGFYNGLSFHRVVPNFIIQTGKPPGSNTEFRKQYKVDFNDLPIAKGSVAIVRYTNDPNTADSQFFISTGNKSISNKHYTVFGKVIEGIDIAEKINLNDKIITITLE